MYSSHAVRNVWHYLRVRNKESRVNGSNLSPPNGHVGVGTCTSQSSGLYALSVFMVTSYYRVAS